MSIDGRSKCIRPVRQTAHQFTFIGVAVCVAVVADQSVAVRVSRVDIAVIGNGVGVAVGGNQTVAVRVGRIGIALVGDRIAVAVCARPAQNVALVENAVEITVDDLWNLDNAGHIDVVRNVKPLTRLGIAGPPEE